MGLAGGGLDRPDSCQPLAGLAALLLIAPRLHQFSPLKRTAWRIAERIWAFLLGAR